MCKKRPIPPAGGLEQAGKGVLALIELKHLSKTFPTAEGSFDALREIDLTIADGDIFGVVGMSGAGKSTLVRCINLLERPTAGQVLIDGRDMTALPPKELREMRRSISMIFQQFNLLMQRTCLGNICFPMEIAGVKPAEARKRALELLEIVGLPDKADAYPAQLSGGQKQRIAIARALASDPKVLLCDEATSALDPQTTQSILRLIKDINQKTGITVVVITHEMAVVKEICHRVAVMDKGRVVEEGSVFEVFSNPQQPVTRSFIATTSNLGKIEELIAANDPIVAVKPGEIVARLNYGQSNVSEAAISEVSRRFNVDVSIIFSNTEILDGQPLGGLVALISGDKVGEAIGYLSEKNVMVEVLKRG